MSEVFYIAAVIACVGFYEHHRIITYYVITNCGTSVYTPALGDKLPALAVDFMATHAQTNLPGVRPPVAVFFRSLS